MPHSAVHANGNYGELYFMAYYKLQRA